MPYTRPPLLDTPDWTLVAAGGPTDGTFDPGDGLFVVKVDEPLAPGATSYAFAAWCDGSSDPLVNTVGVNISVRDADDNNLGGLRNYLNAPRQWSLLTPGQVTVFATRENNGPLDLIAGGADHVRGAVTLAGAVPQNVQWELFVWDPHEGGPVDPGGGGGGPVPCPEIAAPPWPYEPPRIYSFTGPPGIRHNRPPQLGNYAPGVNLPRR